jgi:hypothetical protein
MAYIDMVYSRPFQTLEILENLQVDEFLQRV